MSLMNGLVGGWIGTSNCRQGIEINKVKSRGFHLFSFHVHMSCFCLTKTSFLRACQHAEYLFVISSKSQMSHAQYILAAGNRTS